MREPSANGLLRVLGAGFGMAVVVGGVIGQGILRTSGIVARGLGSEELIILAWLLGGVLTMVDAMSTVELGTSVATSGGPYAFARRAFGTLVGFLTGWIDWLAQTATAAFISVVFGECVHRLGIAAAVPGAAISVLMLILLTGAHFIGTRTSGMTQAAGSALKAVILFVIIAALLFGPGKPAAAPPPLLTAAGMIGALRAVYATYGGWNAAAYFCEEVRDVGRALPRATFGGIALVTAIYVLVNIAVLHVLDPSQVAASTLPVVDAAERVLGASGGFLVAVTAAVIVLTVGNTQLMFTPRIVHGMAREGMLPRMIATVSDTGVPTVALLLTGGVAVVMAASGAYERLLAIYAPLSVTSAALVNLAAIRMRWKEPSLERPFRMPLFPLPSLVALSVNGALAVAFVSEDPSSAAWALALIAPAIPLFLLARARKLASVGDTLG